MWVTPFIEYLTSRNKDDIDWSQKTRKQLAHIPSKKITSKKHSYSKCDVKKTENALVACKSPRKVFRECWVVTFNRITFPFDIRESF